MIPALMLMVLLQDGAIRTAPTAEPTPQETVAAPTSVTAAPPEAAASPWSALRHSQEGGYSRNAPADPGNGVPAWAMTDPARWETSQCGTTGDDACRREARNRLAMARAGIATETPAASGGSAAPQNCRMVMQRSETGFGGSLSRVCGDGAEAEAALSRLRDTTTALPAVEPCDRPGSLETQESWITRCRALPPR